MNRRLTLQAVLAAAFASPLADAFGSNVLETSTFEFTLPDGWERNLDTDPVSARGPYGELLQISSSRIRGPGGASRELQEIRKEVEAVGVRTLRLAESEPGLIVETPISRAMLDNGIVLNEVVYRANDSGWKIAQFSVIGPRTSILVSLRVPSEKKSSIGLIRGAITRIRWAAL